MKGRSIALCGVLAALAVVLLTLGGVIPAAVLCAPILAMIILLPVLEELGPRAAWTSYAAAALLALLLTADRETAFVYVFFGWYPILRPKIASLPSRPLRVLARLAVCNAAIFLLYGVVLRFLGLTADLLEAAWLFNALLLLMGNLTFLLVDLVLGRYSALWRRKLRQRFFH